MVSRSITKFIKSLQLKKYRKLEQLFVVEGEKSVLEVLKSSFTVQQILAAPEFQEKYHELLKSQEVISANKRELSTIGSFKTNDSALAVVKMKPNPSLTVDKGYALVLDGINDPGNFGTIIRVADWYGIDKIIASESTADLYNPKVITASKGSFTRIHIQYTDLDVFLKKTELPVYGAFMSGQNVHEVRFAKNGLIVMGNESNGISEVVNKRVSQRISIPKYGHAESLNVGVATAVICDNALRAQS